MRFAEEETYVLVVLTPGGFLRIPVRVSWAAAVPGRLRAVDAESTGPGGRPASYVMVVGGIDGARRGHTMIFVSSRTQKATTDFRGLSGVWQQWSDASE